MEVLFKGLFKARLAHHGVHGVVLIFEFLPLAFGHTAHIAQNMGGVLGVVFPDRGAFHHQTRGVQLQKGREVLVGNVFQEGVGGKVGDTAEGEFIQ